MADRYVEDFEVGEPCPLYVEGSDVEACPGKLRVKQVPSGEDAPLECDICLWEAEDLYHEGN